MVNNKELCIELGSNQQTKSKIILSLKLNTQLINQLSKDIIGQATIQFTDQSTAKIIIDSIEYELKFCEVDSTDSYIKINKNAESNNSMLVHSQMAYYGEVLGRYQITNAKHVNNKEQNNNIPLISSSHTNSLTTSATMVTTTTTSSSKREISLVDDLSNIKKNLSSPAMKKQRSTATITKDMKYKYIAPPIHESLSTIHSRKTITEKESAIIQNNILLLENIPIEASISDIQNSLLSGLSITNFYLIYTYVNSNNNNCSNNNYDQLTNHYVDMKNIMNNPYKCMNIYVEFMHMDGAEIAYSRSGELLTYTLKNNSNNITNNNSSILSNNSKFGIKKISIQIKTITNEEAMCIQAIGWKIINLHLHIHLSYTIKEFIEHLLDYLTPNKYSLFIYSYTSYDLSITWGNILKHLKKLHKDRKINTFLHNQPTNIELSKESWYYSKSDSIVEDAIMYIPNNNIIYDQNNVLDLDNLFLSDTSNQSINNELNDSSNQIHDTTQSITTNNTNTTTNINKNDSNIGNHISKYSLYDIKSDYHQIQFNGLLHDVEKMIQELSNHLSDMILLYHNNNNHITNHITSISYVHITQYCMRHIHKRLSFYIAIKKELWNLTTTYVMYDI